MRSWRTSELLRAMVGQLEIRYVSSHVLASTKEALAYYTMPLDTFTARTVESVVKYRAAIDSSIQRLCDALDDLDYESFMDILDPIVCPRPPSPEGYCGVDYQLEKIFNHFGDNDECQAINAKRQLERFAKGFSGRWVDIDTRQMTVAAARLLVTVSCYLEFNTPQSASNS